MKTTKEHKCYKMMKCEYDNMVDEILIRIQTYAAQTRFTKNRRQSRDLTPRFHRQFSV